MLHGEQSDAWKSLLSELPADSDVELVVAEHVFDGLTVTKVKEKRKISFTAPKSTKSDLYEQIDYEKWLENIESIAN